MPIIRNGQPRVHTFAEDDVKKYGLEKALILGNIHLANGKNKNEIYEIYPYWPAAYVERLIDELIDDGILQQENKDV